jgi:integrase
MLADVSAESKLSRIRDAAPLALGVASGCRRSELSRWLLGALTEHGATIRLMRSKTSQDKEAQVRLQPGLALAAIKACEADDWPRLPTGAIATPKLWNLRFPQVKTFVGEAVSKFFDVCVHCLFCHNRS